MYIFTAFTVSPSGCFLCISNCRRLFVVTHLLFSVHLKKLLAAQEIFCRVLKPSASMLGVDSPRDEVRAPSADGGGQTRMSGQGLSSSRSFPGDPRLVSPQALFLFP